MYILFPGDVPMAMTAAGCRNGRVEETELLDITSGQEAAGLSSLRGGDRGDRQDE